MKMLKSFLFVLSVGSLTVLSNAMADDSMTSTTTTTTTTTTAATNPFWTQEWSFDLFGTLALDRQTIDHISTQRINKNSQLGVGGGINYFFCRYVGVGADAYSANTTGSFVDSSSGNVYLRYPIMNTGIAPYVYGGGGYDFENVRQGFGQAGTGIEFRLVKHLALFVDARYVFAAETRDYAVGRSGIRISF